jgi:hypothetical protein
VSSFYNSKTILGFSMICCVLAIATGGSQAENSSQIGGIASVSSGMMLKGASTVRICDSLTDDCT